MTDALREALQELETAVDDFLYSRIDHAALRLAANKAHAARIALQEPAPVVAREPRAIHALKTWPEAFKAVVSGEKRHEVRRADRDFRAGDVVVLQEFDPASGYTREARTLTIGHISAPGTWGLPVDVCVFTLLAAAPQAPGEPAPVVQPDEEAVERLRSAHDGAMKRTGRWIDPAEFAHGYETGTPTYSPYTAHPAAAPSQLVEDARRLDWLQSWTEGDVALMAPAQHGGPPGTWLVALDSDQRPGPQRGYRWSCEAHGKDLREAIDNCQAKLAKGVES